MEGFTVVLLIAWLVLMACFGGMYYMDQATKKAVARRAKAAEDGRPAVLPGVAVRGTRPAVDNVRLDHDEHGKAAHPIEVAAARAARPLGRTRSAHLRHRC